MDVPALASHGLTSFTACQRLCSSCVCILEGLPNRCVPSVLQKEGGVHHQHLYYSRLPTSVCLGQGPQSGWATFSSGRDGQSGAVRFSASVGAAGSDWEQIRVEDEALRAAAEVVIGRADLQDLTGLGVPTLKADQVGHISSFSHSVLLPAALHPVFGAMDRRFQTSNIGHLNQMAMTSKTWFEVI